MTSPPMRAFTDLWDAARARLAAEGSSLTLVRVHRETGVPVATLSDWRTGNHAPRDADRFLEVVRLLSRWAELPPPNVRQWIQLVEKTGEARAVRDTSAANADILWLPSMVGLGDRISTGFSARQVEVDALCVTGQTLALAIARPVQDIHAGRIRPESIGVRVLLPSRDISLAFPVSVEAPESDDPLHSQWLIQRNTNANSLRTALLSLRRSHGIDVQVSFRAVPFTPMAELYLINGTEALFAYCMVSRREETIDDTLHDVFDASTDVSLQRRFNSGEALDNDTVFVEQSHLWFNSIWETVSADLSFY